MEFWNRGLQYVWSLDGTAPPPGRQAPGYVTPDAGPDGLLTGKSIPTGAPPGVDYMVADADIQVAGQGPRAPAGAIRDHRRTSSASRSTRSSSRRRRWRLLKIDRPLRLASTPTGIESGRLGDAHVRRPAGRARVQRLQPVLHPGRQAGQDQDRRLARRLAGNGQAGQRDDQGRPTSSAARTSSRRWARSRRCCAGPCTAARRACSASGGPPHPRRVDRLADLLPARVRRRRPPEARRPGLVRVRAVVTLGCPYGRVTVAR